MRPGWRWPTRRPPPGRPRRGRPGWRESGPAGPGHGAGGQRVALPGASATARGLARAALAMDDTLMGDMIQAALDRDGVIRTWEDLLVPVLTGIGARYEHSGECVEAEHLLSAVILAALGRHGRPASPGRPDHRAVLLACAPGEQHSLPLYALAAALAERGVGSPGARCRPALPVAGGRGPAHRPGRRVPVVAGPRERECPGAAGSAAAPARCAGWCSAAPAGPRTALPEGARLVETLPGAVAEVLAALGRN